MIADLALRPGASIAPHSNPNLAYFVVIEGGGFVSVGDETARVAAGEAVVWPPDEIHAAWTETTPMRAIVVEFSLRPDDGAIALIAAAAEDPGADAGAAGSRPARATKADGSLAPRPAIPAEGHLPTEREPW